MPFTLSHIVLAPPLARLSQRHLPVAALAMGCMVPDLIRLFIQDENTTTHLWSSLIYPNLFIGLGFTALWYFIYRPAFYRFLGLQHPLNIQGLTSALRFLLAVILSILIGNATHLIWDGLTHTDYRTFAFYEVLSQPVMLLGHMYPLHLLLQMASSIIPLPILAWMGWHYYQQHCQHFPVSAAIKHYFYRLMVLASALGLFVLWNYVRHIPSEIWATNPYFYIGRSINIFMQGWLIIITLGCLLFLFLQHKRRIN